jgi:hypothetical protein
VERLKPYKLANPNGKFEDWVIAANIDRVNLTANGFYKVSSTIVIITITATVIAITITTHTLRRSLRLSLKKA